MRRPGRIIGLALLVPAALAAQDSVRLRLQPPPNTVVTYLVSFELWMSGPGVPTDTAPSMRARTRMTVTFLGRGGDGFDFQVRSDSADMSSTVPGAMDMVPRSGPRTDTMRVSVLGTMMPSPYSARRDSLVKSQGIGGMLGPQASGALWCIAVPDRAIGIGSSWGDTTATTDSTESGVIRGTTRTVNRLERFAREDGRLVAVVSEDASMDVSLDMGQFLMRSAGTIEVDAATGLVIRAGQSANGAMEIGAISMPMRMRMVMERLP